MAETDNQGNHPIHALCYNVVSNAKDIEDIVDTLEEHNALFIHV